MECMLPYVYKNYHKINHKKICIIGLGHVGSPLAVYIANKNFSIIGYDKDQKKIKTLKHQKLLFLS